jgi:hypothetical protein
MNKKELKTSHLLFDQAPLLVRPELACRIGLNEAIVLQQVHYWLENKRNSVKEKDYEKERTYKNGRFWTYDSYKEWQKQFPFWSVSTIERIFIKLENSGILISDNFNEWSADRTKWYTIDYDALDKYIKPKRKSKHDTKNSKNEENADLEQSIKLTKSAIEQSVNLTSPLPQVDVSISSSCGEESINLTKPIPKISSKTSSETVSKISSSSTDVDQPITVDAKNEIIEKKEDEEDTQQLSELISIYNQNIGKSNELIEKEIDKWSNELPFDVIKLEIETCAMYGAKTWVYVNKALSEDKKLEIDTVKKLENKYQQFKEKSSYEKNNKPQRTEMVPDWLTNDNDKPNQPTKKVVITDEYKKKVWEQVKKLDKANIPIRNID